MKYTCKLKLEGIPEIVIGETGKDAAILQIDTRTDTVTGKTTRTPRWNSWLTFRTAK